jgi:hypothetical protein
MAGCLAAIKDVGRSELGTRTSVSRRVSLSPSLPQAFPETFYSRLTLLLVLIQAIIVIALESVIAHFFIENVDLIRDSPARGVPVYLVMFCLSQCFNLIICWDAVSMSELRSRACEAEACEARRKQLGLDAALPLGFAFLLAALESLRLAPTGRSLRRGAGYPLTEGRVRSEETSYSRESSHPSGLVHTLIRHLGVRCGGPDLAQPDSRLWTRTFLRLLGWT